MQNFLRASYDPSQRLGLATYQNAPSSSATYSPAGGFCRRRCLFASLLSFELNGAMSIQFVLHNGSEAMGFMTGAEFCAGGAVGCV